MLLQRFDYQLITKPLFYITPANGKIGHFTHLPHSLLDEKWLCGG